MARYFTIIICLAISLTAFANKNASEFAAQFLSKQHTSNMQKSPTASTKVQLTYASADTVKNELLVYQSSSQGFVILSNIGEQFQVLGYSSNSKFDTSDLPIQLQELIKLYESIPAENFSGIKATQKATIIVEPLLKKAGISLNQFYHSEVGNCPSGCVATAMAQLLAYHKFPSNGKGSHCYNVGVYGQQCANFENTFYNWVNPSYEDYRLLSKHIGIATEMRYCFDNGGSSPGKQNYKNVLRDNFRMHIYPLGLTPNEYVFLELDKNRPVYVEIWGDPGHAVIADGYDSNNFLHLNFGWGGEYDGFYLMNTNATFRASAYTFGTNLASTVLVSPTAFTIDKQDSLNLVAIKAKLNSNWDFSKPMSEWVGVKVIGGRVVELNLSSQNYVQGTIPSEIGQFDKLRVLSIAGNLSGEIPNSIFNLKNLISLSILNYSGNENLNFELPQSIDVMSNLNYLYLNNCVAGKLPSSIGNLKKLQYLNLFNNKLTGNIPSSFENLTQLIELDLTKNELSGIIPENIGNLSELTIMQLSKNKLSGSIPNSIGGLRKIRTLSLDNNQLTDHVPNNLLSCKMLTGINLSNNLLSGSLPQIGDSLTEIVTLDISNNKFEAIPNSIGKLSKLKVLNVAGNKLKNIPNAISNCLLLNNLNASNNQLASLPIDFVLLINLSDLNLSNNLFEDIPASLEYLLNLRSLNFANNKLTSLPDYLGRFSINSLYLSNNNLSGKIPEIILSKKYSDFSLSGNNYSFSDIPQSDSLRNPIGNQRLILFSKKQYSALLGDTLRLYASQVFDKTHPDNIYSWHEYVDATQAAPYSRWIKTDSVFSIVANEVNLNKKYFCVITNNNVPKYIYSGNLRLNTLNQLNTDTFSIVSMSKDEALNERYQTTVKASEHLSKGEISDLMVTLISPWKVRGSQQWQGSTDKVNWVDLSTSMPASVLKSEIQTISETELKLLPKTKAYYRNALFEENCNPQYSDTITVVPWGKVICDTTINVSNSDISIKLDSIDITIPKGTAKGNFKVTVVQSDQVYMRPDSVLYMSPVYDVSLSSGTTFDKPIIVKFKNLNKNGFNLMDIDKYKPAYFDEQLREWILYDNASIDLRDSTLTFGTYHLTKLAWFELAHAGYTHIFTNDRVNVIYKSGDGYAETQSLYSYDFKVLGIARPWESAEYDPDKGGTPNMIRDIATYAKETIDKFESVGFPVPSLRFNIYCKNSKDAAGQTGATTYIAGRGFFYIAPNMMFQSADDLKDIRNYMRSTVAHEYMHYTQDYYMTVMLSNVTWMEATAPLADRIVWKDIDLCEPEHLLSESKNSLPTERSIFDILSMPWYNSYNIPVVSKIAGALFNRSGDYNLASLFLHYMRTYRDGNKLNPVSLLKETSYFETWVGYLDRYIQTNLGSDIGTEYENYVKFLFEGSKPNFNLFDNEPDQDPLKYFKACLNRSVVNKTVYFDKEKVVKDKLKFTIADLSIKMVQIYNYNHKQKMLTKYVKKNKNENLKVYVCKYNFAQKTMELTDISEKDSVLILADAFETEKMKENQYMTYLLFINKSKSASYTVDDDITFYWVPDIRYFDGINFFTKNSTYRPPIHTIAESTDKEALFDQLTSFLYRHRESDYGGTITMYQSINDSTVKTSSSSSSINQTMTYNFLTGDLKINHNSEVNYGNNSINIQEFSASFKNIYPTPFKGYIQPNLSRYYFQTNSTQESINCINNIQFSTTWLKKTKDGDEITSKKTYTGTEYPDLLKNPGNEIIFQISFY